MRFSEEQKEQLEMLKECREIADVVLGAIVSGFEKELLVCTPDAAALLAARHKLEAVRKMRHDFVATIK